MEMTSSIEKQNQQRKGLLKLLVLREAKRAEIRKLQLARTIMEKRDSIANGIQEFEKSLLEKGKQFGLSARRVSNAYLSAKGEKAEIKAEYAKKLEKCYSIKVGTESEILKSISELQAEEMKLEDSIYTLEQRQQYLSFEFQRLKKGLDLDSFDLNSSQINAIRQEFDGNKEKLAGLFTKLRGVRESIIDEQASIAELSEFYRESLKSARIDRANELAKRSKQTFIQRTLGAIFSRFTGVKRFENEVISGNFEQLDVAIEEMEGIQTELEKDNAEQHEKPLNREPGHFRRAVARVRTAVADRVRTATGKVVDGIRTAKNTVVDGARVAKDNVVGRVMAAADRVRAGYDEFVSKLDADIRAANNKIEELKAERGGTDSPNKSIEPEGVEPGE